MDANLFAQAKELAKQWLSRISAFSRLVIHRPLYRYQLAPAWAIVDSVLRKRGREFAIMFPRQSGKNETQAQIEAYLLNLFQLVPQAQIVKASPTFKPQSINAMLRLEAALCNDWNKNDVRKREGYIFQLGQATITFFSAEPQAQAVGASATLLLEGDEAQDISETQWGLKFEPMMASTNATMALWGTAWTSKTLLARTIKRLRAAEAVDGVRRVFIVTPEQVARENPAYGVFVERQVAKHGRHHPLVRTQYFNEEIDAEGGMFPPARRALMQGAHPRILSPSKDAIYAFLLDVAGEDEGATGDKVIVDRAELANPERDAASLTIVEVDLSTLSDPLVAKPTYRAADRRLWVGTKHTALYGKLRALVTLWKPRYIVADATGVGAGITSFLDTAFPGRVLPFVFNSSTKSKLGWDFLSIVETGRWQDWAVPDSPHAPRPTLDAESATFWRELEAVQYEAGLNQTLKWDVPANTRDDEGQIVHDDTVLSAALSAVLDEQEWFVGGPTLVVPGRDPLEEIDRGR